jgi:hypothetical protein
MTRIVAETACESMQAGPMAQLLPAQSLRSGGIQRVGQFEPQRHCRPQLNARKLDEWLALSEQAKPTREPTTSPWTVLAY